MKKLFLCSSFSTVTKLFAEFYGEPLAGKKVAFIPTASKTEKVNFYVESGKKALIKLGIVPIVLDISTAGKEEIIQAIREVDMVYVSGGNTFFLLQEMRQSGADKAIKDAIKSGKCYIGESAGSIIVSPNIEYASMLDSVSAAPQLQGYDGLNAITMYPLPHHTNFPFKKAVEKIIASYSDKLQLCPISNSQAIQVSGDVFEIAGKSAKHKAERHDP